MQSLAVAALCGMWCLTLVKADDDTAKLDELGTYFSGTSGQLFIQLTGDHAIWQDGQRLPYQAYPAFSACGMMNEAFLKAGDNLVFGGPEGFSRFRLDKVSSVKATFTIWQYTSESTGPRRYRAGSQRWTGSVTVSLPLEFTDDSPSNLVQLSHGPYGPNKINGCVISRIKNRLRHNLGALAFQMRPAHYRVMKDIDFLVPPSSGKADLYLPKNPSGKPPPAVVVIHGGGWVEGDKQNPREVSICADLANHGLAVLAINYTLFQEDDPSTLWPKNLHDCKTAVRWLRANAATYAIDAGHIGALGESSGGQLAAMVALTGLEHGLDPVAPHGEYSCRVQAAVDLYGPADFRQRDQPLAMLGKSPAAAPESYALASPASYGGKSDPPILIIHGTADEVVLVQHSQDFAAALSVAGAPHELVLVPGGSHGFDLRPKEMDLRPVVFAFFDKHLRPTEANP